MKTLIQFLFAASLIFFISCGGGSGGNVADETGEETGDDAAGTTITSLSDIPDEILNPQAYDLTTQNASLSASLNRDVSREGQVGEPSRAGCETNTLKKDIIRSAIQPRLILCNMRAMETAAGETAAGVDTFNYWKMDPPEEMEGPPGIGLFQPRVAIKQAGSAFTFVMCNGTEKLIELYITYENGTYDGYVIDKMGEGFEGELDFSADGLPPDSFTYASFTQTFSEDSDFFTGSGSATLLADPSYNIVSGFYSGGSPDGGEYAGATYAKFDATEGTAKYRSDAGSYLGQTVQEAFDFCQAAGGCEGDTAEIWVGPEGWLTACGLTDLTVDSALCFGSGDCPTKTNESGSCNISAGAEQIESFITDSTDLLNLVFTVAETSIFFDDVNVAEAPPSSNQPTIEFTSASADVDCSTSDTWTQIQFQSEPDMSACLELQDEMNDWQPGGMCASQ